MNEVGVTIRSYETQDGPRLYRLYRDTVEAVCGRDYTPEQIRAWLSVRQKPEVWNERMKNSRTLVALKKGVTAGFGNMEAGGYLDCFYVHKDFQREGVGRALLESLERTVADDEVKAFTVLASLTARSFFESMGYCVVRENTVERAGESLKNYYMEKSREEELALLEKSREEAAQAVRVCRDREALPGLLWEVVCLYEGFHFLTSKKLPFRYRIKGGELFCDRKAKSITQATVARAYEKILEARGQGDPITGPKRLGIFGAPYVWSILKTVGLAEEL